MMVGSTGIHPFPETSWTLVVQARNFTSPAQRDRALTELCRIYWPPVYSYIRLQGYGPHDAEDLTQGFFARFLERNDIVGVDASRGRLRCYLITAVKNHLINEHKRSRRQKRGGAAKVLSIESITAESLLRIPELRETLSPERVFDRQWALNLLDFVAQTLGDRYQREGKGELFQHLKDFIGPRDMQPTGAALAEALGMTEPALRVAIHRFRERYRKCLLSAVGSTLAPGEDAEEELRHLMTAFQ